MLNELTLHPEVPKYTSQSKKRNSQDREERGPRDSNRKSRDRGTTRSSDRREKIKENKDRT